MSFAYHYTTKPEVLMIVGEREPAPLLSFHLANTVEAVWNQAPLIPMLTQPAFMSGRSRETMDKYYGLPAHTIYVNLLSPNPDHKLWNAQAAAENAAILSRFLNQNRGAWSRGNIKIIALGRKVGQAFRANLDERKKVLPFGTISVRNSIPILLLPHPSPRSHFFNKAENCESLRSWVKSFLEEGH